MPFSFHLRLCPVEIASEFDLCVSKLRPSCSKLNSSISSIIVLHVSHCMYYYKLFKFEKLIILRPAGVDASLFHFGLARSYETVSLKKSRSS